MKGISIQNPRDRPRSYLESPKGDVTVMAPGFAQNLFLLSPALHWAVLINTNAWYGCEEGIQTLGNEVFEHHKLCDPPTYASREVEVALRGVNIIQIDIRVFKDAIS